MKRSEKAKHIQKKLKRCNRLNTTIKQKGEKIENLRKNNKKRRKRWN
jgi:type II secretory pathway component PulM